MAIGNIIAIGFTSLIYGRDYLAHQVYLLGFSMIEILLNAPNK